MPTVPMPVGTAPSQYSPQPLSEQPQLLHVTVSTLFV